MPEGAFVVSERGRGVALPTGDWAFIFHAGSDGTRRRPMLLMPSQTLQRLQRLLADRGVDTPVRLSGQVFVYGSVNAILPSAYTIVRDTETPATPPSQPSDQTPGEKTSDEPTRAQPTGDPSVDELIAQLERQRPRPRALESTSATGEPTPPQATGDAIAEGTQVLRRRVRLSRSPAGATTIVFDTGSAGKASDDRPLHLLPCRLRERMEGWAGTLGDAASFTVSGVVYSHEGTGYLLPTAFTVNRPGDVSPRQ